MSKKKREENISSKRRPSVKKRADIWNPSIVDSIGQMNHYCGNWKGDAPQDILQSGALLYYIPPPPSPTPGANVAKTDNDSTRGHRIGLLGQTISIIHCSVDLIFLRVQCKQAPSHDVFVYWWAFGGFPCAQLFACRAGGRLWCRRSRSHPWFGKILWKRKWQPTPVFLPGESHGRGAGRL